MEENEKLVKAKAALLSFVEQVKSDNDQIALSTFSDREQEIVKMAPIATNRDRLQRAINELRPTGRTALYDAILGAAERLSASKQTDRINAVVVMTDGLENASRRVASSADPRPLIRQLQELERKNNTKIMVFAVAYGDDADLKALQLLSESTKAQAFQGKPETIRRLYELLSAFFS
jgi:Ca-activated chloride channel family protein